MRCVCVNGHKAGDSMVNSLIFCWFVLREGMCVRCAFLRMLSIINFHFFRDGCLFNWNDSIEIVKCSYVN